MADFPYLIIGGGMTGAAAAQAIRAVDPTGSIGMISAEPDPPYKRPPLTKKLWQGKPESIVWSKLPDGVTTLLDTRVDEIHADARQVVDQHGRAYGYGKLLLATGGTPRRLESAPGGVLYFRTFADYKTLRGWTGQGARFAVLGSGFIGAEVAQALAANGEQVLLSFRSAGIGASLYPPDLSAFLNDYYREKGVDVRPGKTVREITHQGQRFTLWFDDDSTETVDHVVAGLGIRPNVELAQAAGVELLPREQGGGMRVDAFCQTNLPGVYAAGDAAGFFNPALGRMLRMEHADNAMAMGEAAGKNMAGQPTPYTYLPFFYSDMFDLGYEAIGALNPQDEITADWQEPFRKGVVYYQNEGKVRGVLLWNVWDQVDAARALITGGQVYPKEALKGRIQG